VRYGILAAEPPAEPAPFPDLKISISEPKETDAMNKFLLTLPLLAALISAGCSGIGGFSNRDSDTSGTGADSRRSGPKVSDSDITASIKSAFKLDPELAAANISVNSDNGVVTLSGSVPNAQTYNRAISVARSAEGVRPPVRASNLTFPQ
jgi:hyperosmotically inducible protein